MVRINHILCGIDFSDFSLEALRHGLVLARWYSARLTLLHVYPATRPLVETVPGGVPIFLGTDPEIAKEEVRRLCGPLLEAAGRDAEIVVCPGDPTREITKQAEQLGADLLILGTHGKGGFERLFLGSVAEKVLRSTPVPVLTIPPPVREPRSPVYKTILCPVEFSGASLRALEYALSLAREAGARLIVLHAIEEVLARHEGEALAHLPLSEHYRRLERDARERLDALIPGDAADWCRPETRLAWGRAHEQILGTVAAEHVELVVMGVQGRSAVNRWVFGSTTHRVIREAACPVLTLRAPTDGG